MVRRGLCLSLVGALLALRTLLHVGPIPPPSPDPPSLGRGDVSGGLSLFCLASLMPANHYAQLGVARDATDAVRERKR